MQNWTELLKEAVTRPGIIGDGYRAFHNYSLGNQMAATAQLLTRGLPISPIASYRAWQEKGRNVKKGEKAIALCMPVTCKGSRKAESGEPEEFTFSRFVWRNNWFSLDQTDGAEFSAPVVVPGWDRGRALAALEIAEQPFAALDGNIQGYAVRRQIAVNPLAQYPHKTTFHELAHIVLGHTSSGEMSDSGTLPRDIKELEAESVAYILCSLFDLPGLDESRGYIQSWFTGQQVPERAAQRIFSAADKIFKAGSPE